MTEDQAAHDHESAVGIARYDDLVRPVADGHSDGFCKLIADRRSHAILGAHVLGEYSAETVQVVATAMAAGMSVEQLAEMQFAFLTFTGAVSMAAQKACRTISASGNSRPLGATSDPRNDPLGRWVTQLGDARPSSGASGTSSTSSRNSSAILAIEKSPGCMPSAAPGGLSGLIFTYFGSAGSDQTSRCFSVNHRLIFTMTHRYPSFPDLWGSCGACGPV
jgi:hypothetical protein